MKNKLIPAALVIVAFAIQANAQSHIAFYQVENENYLQFESYKPNTILEYYSTEQGGKQLGSININAAGETQQIFSIEKTPAFVLNRKSNENINGNNQVSFLWDKEFVADHIQMNVIAGNAIITWNAQIGVGNDIEFQIMKSVDNAPYKSVKTIKGNAGEASCNYSFTESFKENASYQLHIVKDGKKLRYASNNINVAVSSMIKVYPTIVKDNAYVDIPGMEAPTGYIITDMLGNTMMNGMLSNSYNVLDVHQLSTGNYILCIRQNDESKSFKITKE